MIESKRSDKKKNTTKVLKELVKNPLASEREIAKNTWLGNWTVNRAKKEMEQIGAKIPQIQDICDADFEIVKLVQAETRRRLQNPDKETFWDIIRAWAESTKRYTIFKWDITDKDWGLKNIDSIEII